MNDKIETLMGGRPLKLTFEDGTQRDVTVRQLAVRDYRKAFPLVDDEIALAALAAGLNATEIGALTPASYEELHQAVQEVNAQGFFVWSARQLERAQKQMAVLPPEMLRQVMASTLPPPSPTSPPRRA